MTTIALILAAILAWRELQHLRIARILIAQRQEVLDNFRTALGIAEQEPTEATDEAPNPGIQPVTRL